MPAGLASLGEQAQALPSSFWRLRSGERLQGKQPDRAGDLRRAGAGGGEPRRGACPTGGLYADLAAAFQLGLRQYFQQKTGVPGDPPANISLVVERIDPGAAVYVCLVADAMARQSCWRVYARSIC